jgi:hypothetical protein
LHYRACCDYVIFVRWGTTCLRQHMRYFSGNKGMCSAAFVDAVMVV